MQGQFLCFDNGTCIKLVENVVQMGTGRPPLPDNNLDEENDENADNKEDDGNQNSENSNTNANGEKQNENAEENREITQK